MSNIDYQNGFMAGFVSGAVEDRGIEPLDHTVTFIADGEPYEIVSVKNGNSVNAPATEPTSESGNFTGWQNNGKTVGFPYPPTETNVELVAFFIVSQVERLYSFYNVDKTEYPFVFVQLRRNEQLIHIFFSTTATTQKIGGAYLTTSADVDPTLLPAENETDYEAVVDLTISTIPNSLMRGTDGAFYYGNSIIWTNKEGFTGHTPSAFTVYDDLA